VIENEVIKNKYFEWVKINESETVYKQNIKVGNTNINSGTTETTEDELDNIFWELNKLIKE
jgi:hypothetical protein